MDVNINFNSAKSREIYLKIIDDTITKYDEDLSEVSNIDPDNYTPELMKDLLDFCSKPGNFLDTLETNLYKKAVEDGITTKLLFKDGTIFDDFDVLEQNEVSLKKIYFSRNNNISFDEFLEGCIWQSENPAEVIYHFSKVIPNFVKEDYDQILWNNKVESWLEEDRNILNTIYARQLDLLMVSIHPDITKAYNNNKIQIKNRELLFDVLDNEDSITFSVYDKFIFFNPNPKVPFAKINIFSDTLAEDVYKVYTLADRSSINIWLAKDEKIEDDSPFSNEDYIFFLIQTNEEESSFAECYLSANKLSVNIPSSYNIKSIEESISKIVSEVFHINLSDTKENSVVIECFMKDFPNIDTAILQYYLANNNEASMYIKETNGVASGETRKVKMYYKPVSENSIEEYIVQYDTSSHERISIKGPSEKNTVNFFLNNFGRTINAFFLRQSSLRDLINNVIYGIDYVVEKVENNKSKKKKNSSTSDPHLITKNRKIDLIKSLIVRPVGWGRYCLCNRQPIILTDEEAVSWQKEQQTFFDKDISKFIPKSIKTFTTENGKRLNFTCPTNEYPDIYLTRESKDSSELVPCCWYKKRKESVPLENIKMATRGENTDSDEEETVQAVIEKEAEVSKDTLYLPLELNELLIFFSGKTNIKIQFPSKKIASSIFLQCVILAINNDKLSVKDYRLDILNKTNPILLSQEALGISKSPEEIHSQLGDINYTLDSKVHYRALEEYFNVNIFVFEITDLKTKENDMENDFELEIPFHKIFSTRTLRRDRSCIILLRKKNNNEYALITDMNGNGLFNSSMSLHLMDLYLHVHQTSIMKKDSSINNIYSRIDWEEFFKSDPITSQEIDICGKTRVVQLRSGMTIAISPCQPFNVPMITAYVETPLSTVKRLFGEPHQWDDKGFWYDIMKIPFSMYVLTGYHDLPLMPEKNTTLPLNPFVPKNRFDIELLKRTKIKRAVNALIQIIHWAWRLDGRPSFKKWISRFINLIQEPDEDDIINYTPDLIHASLPNTNTVKEGFQQINLWWPEIFNSSGKINLWQTLINRILQFFERESTILENYKSDPPQKRLLGFYNSVDDYPFDPKSRVFISRDSFNLWARVDRNREENSQVTTFKVSSLKDISYLSSNKNPTRILYENRWLSVFNVPNNDYILSLKASYHWYQYNKILSSFTSSPLPGEDFQVLVYGFSKNFDLVEIELINPIQNGKVIEILKYPDDTYASILI